jgi:ABC-2 type transport system permease protein
MSQVGAIFKRDFLGYFRTPVAYVFLVVFLMASVGLGFFVGQFFKSNVATMESFFTFFPWYFLFFAPAVGMRLWAEERRSGTIELLFTLPVTTLDATIGKFLAGWAFLALTVLLSFPMPLTLAYLGNPDWGVVVTSYCGTILMAGAYLGVASLCSALTKNQIIAFVIGVFVCLLLMLLGWSVFTPLLDSFLPVGLADILSNFSFITHFGPFLKGIVDPKDVMFFLSLIGFTLFLNVLALER